MHGSCGILGTSAISGGAECAVFCVGETYMKTDRLLGITVYLLRHGLTSANALAERFEVSLRTIQRDAEFAFARPGIPIYSRPGAGGGYGIMEEYRLEHIAANAADVALIQTALEGLHSAHPTRGCARRWKRCPCFRGSRIRR